MMANLPQFLEEKGHKLNALRDALSAPDTTPVQLAVKTYIAGGSGTRVVQTRQFTIVTDSGPALAGYDLGPTSPELLLGALGSCVAHTYLMLAVQQGVTLEALEVAVTAEIDYRGMLEMRAESPVPVHNIGYTAHVVSPASDAELGQLRADVDRLCPVLQALVQPIAVESTIVRQADEQAGDG